MKVDFDEAIQRVIDRITPSHRKSTRKDFDGLRARGATSWDGLVAVLRDVSAGEDRAKACWLLSRLGDARALPELLRALRDPDSRLRVEAAFSLGTLGNRRAVRALIGTLKDDLDANIRMAAAHSLGELDDKRSSDALLEKLGDSNEDPRVRGQAAEALGRTARAIPDLIRALEDSSVEVRYWAAFALGELGDSAALPALERLAQSDDAIRPGSGSIKEEALAAIEGIRRSRRKT